MILVNSATYPPYIFIRHGYCLLYTSRNRGIAGGTEVSFGTFGLKAVGRGRLTARQIEAARRAMTRAVKRQGKIWIRVFPDKPITEKPLEVRMGKGKGNVEYWVALILSLIHICSSRYSCAKNSC